MVTDSSIFNFTAQQLWDASESAATSLAATHSFAIFHHGATEERSTDLFEPVYELDEGGDVVFDEEGNPIPVLDENDDWVLGPLIETLLLEPEGTTKTPLITLNNIGVLVSPLDSRTYQAYPARNHSGLRVWAAYDIDGSDAVDIVAALKSVKAAVKTELAALLV